MRLTEEQKSKIIKAAQEWLVTPGEDRTQAALASRADLSKGMMSQIAAGKTVIGESPIADQHFLKLNQILGVSLTNAALHWETTKFKTIVAHLDKAKKLARRVVIAGDTGVSKTYTAKWFARTQARSAYIRLSETDGTRDLMNALVREMQLVPARKGERAIMDALEEKVTAESGWDIKFDECEDKKNRIYRRIKAIADTVEGKASVVLLGLDLIEKLGKQATRKAVDMPQLCRRFFPYSVELDCYSTTDTVEVLNLVGIQDKELRAWLIEETNDFDFLHKMIADMQEVANGKPLTMAILNSLFSAE